MSEKYTGRADDRRYEGDEVDITYNLKRCIHAKFCVNGLSSVFDIDKRPWIDADGAGADKIADVIGQCPSGALHYDRKDGGAAETPPETNTVTVWDDSYLSFHGDLTIQGATVDITGETRATLCRCGASSNKPFCDNTHRDIEFETGEPESKNSDGTAASGGTLRIDVSPDGPYVLDGNFQIRTADGREILSGDDTALCRCGQSDDKPFCDGTHKRAGFEAE